MTLGLGLRLRAEGSRDGPAIRRVTEAAFAGVAYSSGTEGAIVDALRAAGALALSLVAVEGEEIVGHVAFSAVTIGGTARGWYGLGPVSVAPGRQRQGIGSALIREGLARLAAGGAGGCVVLGDPGYYGRFGFIRDPGMIYPDAPAEYFQRLCLAGTAPEGVVAFHPAFDAA